MRYKLAAFDLDGTLLDSQNRMGEATAAALQRLVDAGVVIAPATARAYSMAIRAFPGLETRVGAICCGGGDVRAPGGEVVGQFPLPAEFAAFLARLADASGWEAVFQMADRAIRRDNVLPPWAEAARPHIHAVTSFDGVDLAGLLSVIAVVTETAPGYGELCARLGEVQSHRATLFDGREALSITPPGVDKGSGLRALCAAAGLDPADAVVFGDSEVDLPMFAVAGLSVAMENATPEVKAAADIVTGRADDDGVAAAIARIWD